MSSKKLIVLVGISGAGKSTFASTTVRYNPDRYITVNRDKIRELLFGYTEETVHEYYGRSDFNRLEKQVTLYEDTLIHEGLMQDKTVIVDSTNLKHEYLKRFEYWNVPVEYMYFDVSIKDAIERDSKRVRKVGEEVIRRQYNSYINLQREGLPVFYSPKKIIQDENLSSCIIFDIDNTLAHKGNRSAYDWKAIGKDSVDLAVSTLYIETEGKFNTIVCTGRDSICEKETLQWFKDNYLPIPTEFHMRKEKDMRPDWVVKEEMWRDIATRYNILYIVDDRNQVVRRARSLGLKVFQVEYGNF